MKRSSLIAIFSGVKTSIADAAERIVHLVVDGQDGSLGRYFATLVMDEDDREYCTDEEYLDLRGVDDLHHRLSAGAPSMFKIRAPMKIANADIYVGLWNSEPTGTTVMLEIDPEITRFFEAADADTRAMIIGFLASIGHVLDADWFVCGPNAPWRAVRVQEDPLPASLGPSPYILARREGIPGEAELQAAEFGLKKGREGAMLGYRFVTAVR